MSTNQTVEEYIDDWVSYLGQSRTSFQENWERTDKKAIQMKQFSVIKKLGEGSFGKVVLAKKNTSYYAIKIITIGHASNSQGLEQVENERRVLQAINFPFIIHLEFYFSDSGHFYFAMPFVAGGDLWHLLRKEKQFSESQSMFYSSQVVLALEYLHYCQIIYRDLKPENILVDMDGYLKLADLGFCKKIRCRTYTFCGTPEYMAPEVILCQGYSFAADWWSLGVMVYELVAGWTPFVAPDQLGICKNIVQADCIMPRQFSPSLKKLLECLLQKSPYQRLGSFANGASDIKQQKWFHDLDWLAVLNKQLPAPFLPKKQTGNVSRKVQTGFSYKHQK